MRIAVPKERKGTDLKETNKIITEKLTFQNYCRVSLLLLQMTNEVIM
jgi:hypothetical protein